MELVAIQVKLGKHPNKGEILYPDFNQLQVVKDSGVDWMVYVDLYGSGWLYDKKYGHAELGPDSPVGTWLGCLLVPKIFADEAIAMYPALVTKLIETEFEIFYDERNQAKTPDEIINKEILEGIKTKQDLELVLTTNQNKALDPEDDTPGIVKNKRKMWVDYKQLMDITIV